jgi:hypothetical protein
MPFIRAPGYFEASFTPRYHGRLMSVSYSKAAGETACPTLSRLSILFVVLAVGCQQKLAPPVKVLAGGTTIVSPGATPIEDSVVIIAGPKIQSVGTQKDVNVPKASDRTDLTGKWVVPAAGASIAPGARANLVILTHPPNGKTSDATALIVDGEWKLPGKP